MVKSVAGKLGRVALGKDEKCGVEVGEKTVGHMGNVLSVYGGRVVRRVVRSRDVKGENPAGGKGVLSCDCEGRRANGECGCCVKAEGVRGVGEGVLGDSAAGSCMLVRRRKWLRRMGWCRMCHGLGQSWLRDETVC